MRAALRVCVVVLLAGMSQAAEIEFAARLPEGERTQERLAEASADKEKLAIAMIQMSQAQLLESDARLQLSEAQRELQGALMAMGSLDQARSKIVQASLRLSETAAEAKRRTDLYSELAEALRKKYHADSCQPNRDLKWACPEPAAQPAQAGETESEGDPAEQ